MLPAPSSSFGFQIPDPVNQGSDFQTRQIRDNYNQDKLHKFRGTLARMRRKAMLSKDPQQLNAYLQLAQTLNVDPAFSATGRADDRHARAENKFQQNTQAAQLFQQPQQQPMGWLLDPNKPFTTYY